MNCAEAIVLILACCILFLVDDSALKSGRRKVQMEEMAYIRGKNDINRHIR